MYERIIVHYISLYGTYFILFLFIYLFTALFTSLSSIVFSWLSHLIYLRTSAILILSDTFFLIYIYSICSSFNCILYLIFPATTKYNNNDKFPFAIIV